MAEDLKYRRNSLAYFAFKLLENPGRVVFPRGALKLPAGETTPDSFSPEYLLLVQERARIELSRHALGRGKPSWFRFPVFFVRAIFAYFQLKAVNALVASYLNEQNLKQRFKSPDV
jgi:hypothetical protein